MNKEHYLEIENASLHAKLRVALKTLRNAQQVIKARKSEITQLKQELARKTELLHSEMLANEATNYKLAQTMRRLTEKYSQTVITSNQQFAEQLTYLEKL